MKAIRQLKYQYLMMNFVTLAMLCLAGVEYIRDQYAMQTIFAFAGIMLFVKATEHEALIQVMKEKMKEEQTELKG